MRPSRKGSVQAINYFVANNYIGALKALAEAKNQKVMILPHRGIIGDRRDRRHRRDRA